VILQHLLNQLAAIPWNITANEIHVPNSTGDLGTAIGNIIRILMTLIGMLAVIFVIVGGIQYAVSGGDSKRTSQAKETILYACVGVAVSIAAIAIITFVTSHVG